MRPARETERNEKQIVQNNGEEEARFRYGLCNEGEGCFARRKNQRKRHPPLK